MQRYMDTNMQVLHSFVANNVVVTTRVKEERTMIWRKLLLARHGTESTFYMNDMVKCHVSKIHIEIWAFDQGGGGGDTGHFDAKLEFFWPFFDFCHDIGDMSYAIRCPPYFGHGESKNQGPMSKRDSGRAGRSREVCWFSGKTLVSLNSRPQPTTGRACISNISFRCRKKGRI